MLAPSGEYLLDTEPTGGLGHPLATHYKNITLIVFGANPVYILIRRRRSPSAYYANPSRSLWSNSYFFRI